jgi:hypothetical protein
MIWKRILNKSAAEDFILDIATFSPNSSITLPASSTSTYPLIIEVDWGDGTPKDIINSNVPSTLSKLTHTYVDGDTYVVRIKGQCPSFLVQNGSIKENIIGVQQWGDVFLRRVNFYGCSEITTLPSPQFGLTALVDANGLLRNTSVVEIPDNIFTKSPQLTNVSDAFSFTKIEEIPPDLFKMSPSITNYSSCFNGCSELSLIPPDLLENATSGTIFTSMFRNCLKLESIPPLLFNNISSPSSFSDIFNMSTTANALTGLAPTLWNQFPAAIGTRAFRNCEGLDNYNNIPTDWK